MAKKGKAKNGGNKAKHSKLLKQKKNRVKGKKEANKLRLKQLNSLINKQKEEV